MLAMGCAAKFAFGGFAVKDGSIVFLRVVMNDLLSLAIEGSADC